MNALHFGGFIAVLGGCGSNVAAPRTTAYDSQVRFDVVGAIIEQETIAQGRGIRELARLRRVYGPGRWRKRKGIARIRFADGTTRTAELHWYEAHGVGRKELKIKRFVG